MAVIYVTRVPNRGSPPAVLLRERYREDGEVKNRTLANLSSWPEPKVEALTAALKGQAPAAGLRGAFEISRSLPHGHVATVAMIIAAVIDSSSKLAIADGRRAETAARSLGDVLGLSSCDEDDLYAAMDWLLAPAGGDRGRPGRHLRDETLVLYDIQPTLFDETDMAEITSPDYPGERLIACYNPFLAAERARERGELLDAAEAERARIDAATRRSCRPPRGQDAIALAAGEVITKKKTAKHFIVNITDAGIAWRRDEQKIADEVARDGICGLRTSLPADTLGAGAAVGSYRALDNVEQVFRGPNTNLLIRPVRTGSPAFALTTTPRRSSAAFDLLGLSCHLGHV